MQDGYELNIINAAISKLKDAEKSLSDLELTAGIVKRLKVKLGDKDKRHSSKIRFRKDFFKSIIETIEWKNEILQMSDKKFILKKDLATYTIKNKVEWEWSESSYEEAIKKTLANLSIIDPFKIEKLVKDLLNKIYIDYDFIVTQKTGDGGIDVIGKSKNIDLNEAVFVQVKRHKGTISRDKADAFHGAITSIKKKENYLKVTGLYITTGKYSSSFLTFLNENQEKVMPYISWNGEEFAKQMLKHGFGVKYSIDNDFWTELDSKAVIKSKKEK